MNDSRDRQRSRTRGAWTLALASTLGAALAVQPAAAHAGTTHAGTPHWLLLALVAAGVGAVLGADALNRRRAVGGTTTLALAGIGVTLTGVGALGLVEIQVTAAVGPALTEWYPLVSRVLGSAVMLGSLLVGYRYWPERPRYAALGALLGAWIAYPAVMPTQGLLHPLGYLLVVALPVLVGYVLWTDARPLLRSAFARPAARRAAVLAGLGSAVFLSVSAGTLTFNPDYVTASPDSFVVLISVASPLVYWPAVEFSAPAVQIAGVVSLGTVLLFGVVGTLVGCNAALVTDRWLARSADPSRRAMLGTASATGATACCCCAPAMYGVVSVLLGTSASPVYWAFMDTSSPLGAAFLSGSVLLLVGSILRADPTDDRSCAVPGESAGTDAEAA